MHFPQVFCQEGSGALWEGDLDDDHCSGCGSLLSYFNPQDTCSQCDRVLCHKCLVESPHSANAVKTCHECQYGPHFSGRRVGVDKQVEHAPGVERRGGGWAKGDNAEARDVKAEAPYPPVVVRGLPMGTRFGPPKGRNENRCRQPPGAQLAYRPTTEPLEGLGTCFACTGGSLQICRQLSVCWQTNTGKGARILRGRISASQILCAILCAICSVFSRICTGVR